MRIPDDVKSWLVAAVVMLIGAFTVFNGAHAADPYLIIGGGVASHPMQQGNGHWRQDGFSQKFDTVTPTYTLGAGYELGSGLAVEVDYRDLGGLSGAIAAVSDADYHACACDAGGGVRYWSLNTNIKGVGLSGLIERRGFFARAGLFVHRSRFEPTLLNRPEGFVTYEGDPKPFNETALGYMLGAGYRFGRVRAELTYFPNVATGGAPNLHVYTFTLSTTF